MQEMFKSVLLIFIITRQYVVGSVSADTIRNDVDASSDFMATKSTYFKRPATFAHKHIPWNLTNVPQGYVPFHVDALYRHGSRYPSKDKLALWKSIATSLQKFCDFQEINETIRLWDEQFPKNRNYTLHEKGWKEHSSLADKLFQMTGQIFMNSNIGSTESTLTVLSSAKVRVLASANAFLKKLTCILQVNNELSEDKSSWLHFITLLWEKLEGGEACGKFEEYEVVMKNNSVIDGGVVYYSGIPVHVSPKLLRAFDHCTKYNHAVESNRSADHEYRKFFSSTPFIRLRNRLSKLLGTKLNETDVNALYQICTFQSALHDDYSICKLFSNDHLQVMEYSADLKHYYKTGYGYDINYRLSCNLLHDIVSKLDAAIANNGKSSAVLRFGHAETLIPLLCLLGLYKDEVPLTASNYEMHKHSRMFRTGTFSPFAGNIIFALYKSQNGNVKIAIVVNDHLVQLPSCHGCYFCDYQVIRHLLLFPLHKFQCERVCDIHTHDEL